MRRKLAAARRLANLVAGSVGSGPHGATVRLRVLGVRLWWGQNGVHGLIWRARTAWRPPQPVLWGGRWLMDWPVGSQVDLLQARRARQAAAVRRQQEAMLRVSIAFGEAFSVQLRAAERAIAQLDRSSLARRIGEKDQGGNGTSYTSAITFADARAAYRLAADFLEREFTDQRGGA